MSTQPVPLDELLGPPGAPLDEDDEDEILSSTTSTTALPPTKRAPGRLIPLPRMSWPGGAFTDFIPEEKVPEPFRSFLWGTTRGVGNLLADVLGTAQMVSPIEDENVEKARKEMTGYVAGLPQGKRLEDVKGVGEAVEWLAGLTGEQLPIVGATALGGMGGGAFGAGVVSYILNAGESYNNLRERGVRPGPASIAAGLTGAGKTALDIVVPLRVMGKTKFLPPATWMQWGKELGIDSLIEGGTEAGQEGLDIVTELLLGVNRPEENLSRVLNAAAAGAMTGSVYGVALSQKPVSVADTTLDPVAPPKQLEEEPLPTPKPKAPGLTDAEVRAALGLSRTTPLAPLADTGIIRPVGEGLWEFGDDLETLPDGRVRLKTKQGDIVIDPKDGSAMVAGEPLPDVGDDEETTGQGLPPGTTEVVESRPPSPFGPEGEHALAEVWELARSGQPIQVTADSIAGVTIPDPEVYRAVRRHLAYMVEYSTIPVTVEGMEMLGAGEDLTEGGWEQREGYKQRVSPLPSDNWQTELIILEDGLFVDRVDLPPENPQQLGYTQPPSTVVVDRPAGTPITPELVEGIRREVRDSTQRRGQQALDAVWQERMYYDPHGFFQAWDKKPVRVKGKSYPFGNVVRMMVKQFHDNFGRVVKHLRTAGDPNGEFADLFKRLEGVGVLLHSDYEGAWTEREGKTRVYLGVVANTMEELREGKVEVDDVGTAIYSTLLHELAHERVQDREFDPEFERVLEHFGSLYPQVRDMLFEGFIDPETGEFNDKYISFAETISAAMADVVGPTPAAGFLAESTGVGTSLALFKRLRQETDSGKYRSLAEKLERRLRKNPTLLTALLADPEFKAWADETVLRATKPAFLFRARLPGRVKAGVIDLYATPDAARAAQTEPVVSPVEGLKAALAGKGRAWGRIGPHLYEFVRNDQGRVEVRQFKQVIAEGEPEKIFERFAQEGKSYVELWKQRSREIRAYKVGDWELKLVLGDTWFSGISPTVAAKLIEDKLAPNMKMRDTFTPEGKAKKEAKAMEKLLHYWPEKAREWGLADINWKFNYTAKTLMLSQIVDRLPDFAPLQAYDRNVHAYWRIKMEWVERASNLLEDWVRMGAKQAQVLGEACLKVTRKSSTLRRRLTPEEVQAIIKEVGGDPGLMYPMWQRIDAMFLEAGRELVNSLRARAFQTYGPEVGQLVAAKYDKLEKGVEETNYFPMTRFGKFGVYMRDAKGKMVLLQAFIRRSQMEAAAKKLKEVFPDHFVGTRYLGDEETPFIPFPPALFDYLEAHLTLTTEQKEQLREIQQALDPSGRYLRHMLHRELIPGESKDAVAAFAEYFQHYSNHIARLKKQKDLENAVLAMHEASRNVENGAEVGVFATTMARHLDDLLNPVNDGAALRAGVFMYMFMGLPAAAVMNLSQIPIYTYSYLGKRLGNDATAVKVIGQAMAKVMKSVKSGPNAAYSEWEQRMLERGFSDGFIEESFLATVGQFSSKGLLSSFWEGAPFVGYHLHRLGKTSVAMFHGAEVFNRKVTFLAALETAKKLGMTSEEEIYQFARKAVYVTQFEYAYYNRPEIFRASKGLGQIKPMIGLFKMFLQNHLYFAFTNQGGWRFWMMLLALAGIKGLPFASDILNILNLTGTFAKKALGLKNPLVDLELDARRFITSMGVNADYILRGLSSHSFGLAPMAHLFGLPFPAIDFSSMLSTQEVLPFTRTLAQALLGVKKPVDAVQDAFFQTMGAVFTTGQGAAASLLATLKGDPQGFGSARLFPRYFQSIYRSYRALRSGAYLSPDGTVVAKLDMRDPTHVAELVAYALVGAPPRRLTQATEIGVEAREHIAFYEAWKSQITGQMAMGVATHDKSLQHDAVQELRKFQKVAPPEFRFQAGDFQQAVRERLMNRHYRLLGMPPQKRYAPYVKRLYPQPPTPSIQPAPSAQAPR